MAIDSRAMLWNPQIWDEIDRVVMADVGRVRVAQKIFPSQQKLGHDNVQADLLFIGQGPPGEGGPLMVREGITVPFLEIVAKFAITQSQLHGEETQRTAHTLAQLTARKVALAEDLIFFQGTQAKLPPGATVVNGSPQWQGLLNMEGMLDLIHVEPLGGGAGGFGENTFRAVSQGISDLISVGHPGPYALVLETSMFADTHAPVPNTLVTTSDRILPLVEGRFYGTGTLPPYTGLLVSLGGNPTTIHISQDARVVYNFEDPFGNHRFRVMERVQIIPREPNAFVKLQFEGDSAPAKAAGVGSAKKPAEQRG
jgi:uncharacterized linocin/CFP29 family protein